MGSSLDHDPAFIPLDVALSRLPLESPERSAWPALAGRLQHLAARNAPARRRPSWPFAAALAASLLALALIPRGAGDPQTAPQGTALAPTANLAPLMAESARLEALIAASDSRTSSATAAVFALELEDRLQQLDASLADGSLDAARRQALWQERVGLLRDYAGFESTRRWYAAEGRNLDVSLVAAY